MLRKYFFAVLILIAILLLSYVVKEKVFSGKQENSAVENKPGRVFRSIYTVIDGDTFWIKDDDGQIEKIRLLGIDAPESRKSARKDVQYFGAESKKFLKNYLRGKKVAFEYDIQKYDQYGRTLAYVYLEDGIFLNDYLVRNGYAKVYTLTPNLMYQQQLLESERYARENKLGMWAE